MSTIASIGTGPQERWHIVGAGTIGASWSTLYLSNGLSVVVVDHSPNASNAIHCMLDQAHQSYERAGLSYKIKYDPSQLTITSDYGALQAADYVQENGPER